LQPAIYFSLGLSAREHRYSDIHCRKIRRVTGASKGIGKGIAQVFAKNGAKVLVVARHANEAEACAKEIGGGASAFAADVTRLPDLDAMAKGAADRHGGIDILCANAGIFPQAKIEDMSPEQWDEVWPQISRARSSR
jgi:3-oxoacyl-[acyl-carrier protein] reductase